MKVHLGSAFLIMLMVWLVPHRLWGFQEPHHHSMENFDRRAAALTRPNPRADQAAQQAAMARAIPNLTIDFDPVTAAPRSVRARGFLTGPQGRGRGLPAQGPRMAAPAGQDAVLRAFLQEHRLLFGHGPEALDQARILRRSRSARHGMESVVWQQQVDGIDVFQGVLTAHTTAADELVALSSGFLPQPSQAARRGHPNRPGPDVQPGLSAQQAARQAGLAVNLSWNESELVAEPVAPLRADGLVTLRTPASSAPIHARLVWLPMDRDTLRLSWEIVLTHAQRGESFRIMVDAETGDVQLRDCLTHYLSEASYRVFTGDSPTPMSPGHPTPMTNQPPQVMPELVVIDAINTNASPRGWINDGDNTTTGNNVRAHTDLNADNLPDLPRPQGSPLRVFDFAADLDQPPAFSAEASVVQLFYWNNWIHDRLYELGFDEAAGNFQADNFGRGGLGGDPVEADTLDGAGQNNANFTTMPDGMVSRMQMYVFPGPTPSRDASMDVEVVLHEYVHGLSNRRVGGGVGLTHRQSTGLGEGWSDFYALSLLSEPEDDPHGNYAFGAYVSYLLEGLKENYYFGIRRYPYSTDLSINPLTFKDIDPTAADPHAGVPRSSGAPGPADQVHRQGEVWCSALWEARALLVEKYGFATGNQLMLQIVTDALPLTPPNPTFVQARDAVLLADRVGQDGANQNELWQAFAKRGLGVSAEAPPSNTTVGVIEAFDLPDDLSLQPAAGFASMGPQGGPFAPFQRTYSLSNQGQEPLSWQARANVEWISVMPSNGTLPPGTNTVPVRVWINPLADYLAPGMHTAKVHFTNLNSTRAQTLEIELRCGLADHFTESFSQGDQDLSFLSLTLTPNGSPSFYEACLEPVTQFHTDPDEGEKLPLLDDDFATVTLNQGAEVSFYGHRTNVFHVGSNGYLTFDEGDTSFEPTLDAHFDRRRIAGLFLDLDPTSGGTVSWTQLDDRVAVTFDDIALFRSTVDNSFQLELFYDGRLRITWLEIESANGLAGLSPGTNQPSAFLESDLSSYASCARFLTLLAPPILPEGSGTHANAGLARLSIPAETNTTVTLVVSNPEEMTAPPSVTIPTGASEALFDLEVAEDTRVDGTQRVHLSAEAPGFAPTYATILIDDNETATLSLAFPSVATEGTPPIEASLTVNPPPDAPVRVGLASSDVGEAVVPEFVVVRPETNTVLFSVAIPDDREIDGASLVQITAFVTHWEQAERTLTVQDNESLDLTLHVPAEVNEISGLLTQAGRVTLTGTLKTNLTVRLQSSDTNRLATAANLTLPVGTTNASFDLNVRNNALAEGPQTVTLTAQAPGWNTGQALVVVHDEETPLAPSNPLPAHEAAEVSVLASLQWSLTEPGGVPLPSTTFDVFLGTSPELPPATLLGSTSGFTWKLPPLAPLTTYYWRVVAKRTAATPSPIWSFTTRGVDRLDWAPLAARQRVDTPFAVTLTARDDYGTAVTNFTGPAALSGEAGSASGGSAILFSEVNMGTPDLAELVNVSGQPIDATGWKVTFYDSSRWPEPLLTFAIPAGTSVGPGEVFRLIESGTFPGAYPNFFMGTNIAWVHSLSINQIAVLLQTADGEIADFMCAVDAFPSQIVNPRSIPQTAWLSSPLPGTQNSVVSYQRLGERDRHDAGDWTLATPTPAGPHPDLMLPFPDTIRPIAISPTATGPFAHGTWSGLLTVHETAENLTILAETADGAQGISPRVQVFRSNDVSLAISANPMPVVVSSNLDLTLTVYNSGPAAAANVQLTNHLPAQTTFVSVSSTLGMCTNAGQQVHCQLGDLAEGAEARITISAVVTATGILTNRAALGLKQPDATPANDTGTLLVSAVPVPVISIADSLIIEGTATTNHLLMPVSISNPVAHTVTADYDTTDMLAVSGQDYLAQTGTVTFPPGTIAQSIAIPILGDALFEANETFRVRLTNIQRALPGTVSAVGTILNDDGSPGFAVEDASVVEGDAGATNAAFTVRLTQVSGLPATVRYATANNSALAEGLDYESRAGLLTIPAGETTAVVAVPVLGDTINETLETYFLNLSQPTNAFLLDGQAVGSIVDDDPLPLLSAQDAMALEGRDVMTPLAFSVRLQPHSGKTVSINYATTNGTAEAGLDYLGTNGTLFFAPGQTNQTIQVYLLGDEEFEPDETFFIRLSTPINATLARSNITAIIVNDDHALGDAVAFAWDPVPDPQLAGQPWAAGIRGIDAFEQLATNFNGTVRFRAYAGGSASRRLLSEPPLLGATTNTGSRTVGYAFTPSTNILVTHVCHAFGQRFTLWTDAGEVLGTQNLDSDPGHWRQTMLDTPVALQAGRRYRVGLYTGSGNPVYFSRHDLPANFPHGTVHLSLQWEGDAFPVSASQARWHLLDLRYLVGGRRALPVSPATSGNFVDGIWSGELQIEHPAPDAVILAEDAGGARGLSKPFAVLPVNDLQLEFSASARQLVVNELLTYTMAVRNSGPDDASNAVLEIKLPLTVDLVSWQLTQGTLDFDTLTLTAELGDMAPGARVEGSLQVRPRQAGTNLVAMAAARRDGLETFAENNQARLETQILYPITILSQPEHQNLMRGGRAQFSVKAHALVPLQYQWHHNGEPISGGTNAILVRPSAQTQHAGSYRVLITAGPETLFSENAHLTVNNPPVDSPPGYFEFSLPPGYSALANPLTVGMNTIGRVLFSVPEGTTVLKAGRNGYQVNNYCQGWSNPDMCLMPGEGFFIKNPRSADHTLFFFGQNQEGTLIHHLPSGDSLVSSMAPQSGGLASVLAFPANASTRAFKYHPPTGGYLAYATATNGWTPAEPALSPGEPVRVQQGDPSQWVRQFSTFGADSGPYEVYSPAMGATPGQVNFFTYHNNPGLGRVLDEDGATPVAANYRGQLVGGVESDQSDWQPLTPPTAFLTGDYAGYIRSGLVSIPQSINAQTVYVQLRIWPTNEAATYEVALAQRLPTGKSKTLALTAGSAFSGSLPGVLPPDVNAFPNFPVSRPPTNTPPTLAPVPDQTVHAGMTLVVTNQASDQESMAGELTFALPFAPPGASVDSASGIFQWTPSDEHSSTTNAVVVRVTDSGIPPLSADQSFSVRVLPGPSIGNVVRMFDGIVQLTWEAIPGVAYEIQYKDNLNHAAWIPWPQRIVPGDSAGVFLDTSSPTEQRFYRIVVP